MQAFIKAIEIWAPDEDKLELKLIKGNYGDLKHFEEISLNAKFKYGEGLPGKAWSERRPMVLDELEDSFFKRVDAAKEAGITAAIALPIFAGDFLKSVVVFLCGSGEESLGAVEVWHCDEKTSSDLALMEGYFGRLNRFEFVAKNTKFRKGVGLPGKIWESNMPTVVEDLGSSHRFLRKDVAEEAGVTTGFGLPISGREGEFNMLLFLSAKGSPIARQFEIWLPSKIQGELVFGSGYSEKGINLNESYKETILISGEGVIGRVYLTGVPTIVEDLTQIKSKRAERLIESGLTSSVVFPLMEAGKCKCVIAMYS